MPDEKKAIVVAAVERARCCLVDCANDAAAAAEQLSGPDRALADLAVKTLRDFGRGYERIAGIFRGAGFGFDRDRN